MEEVKESGRRHHVTSLTICPAPCRLMLTMGVARSLGDYDLIHRASLVNMKEFLTPQPEVRVFPAYKYKFGCEVVLQKVPSEANPKVRNHGEGPY